MSSACVRPRAAKRRRVELSPSNTLATFPAALLRYTLTAFLFPFDALFTAGALRCTCVALCGVFQRAKLKLPHRMIHNIPINMGEWVRTAESLITSIEVYKLSPELAVNLHRLPRLEELQFSFFDTDITDAMVMTFPLNLSKLIVRYGGSNLGATIAPGIAVSSWKRLQGLCELQILDDSRSFKPGVLQHFSQLTTFDGPCDSFCNQAAHVSQLTKLRTKSCSMLQQLTNLTSLDISHSYEFDDSALCSLLKLVDLTMVGCDHFTDRALAPLGQLTSLNIHGCKWFSDLAVRHLSNLVCLDMSGTSVRLREGCLDALTDLQWLDISECSGFSDHTLRLLTNLTFLDVSDCRDVTILGTAFASMHQLRTLYATHCTHMPLTVVSHLRRLKQLTRLSLGDHIPNVETIYAVFSMLPTLYTFGAYVLDGTCNFPNLEWYQRPTPPYAFA